MSNVLQMGNGPARPKLPLETVPLMLESVSEPLCRVCRGGRDAIWHGEIPFGFHSEPMYFRHEYQPEDFIHDAAFHCADYKDFCNRMLDECWPLLRAQFYQDFLFRKVPTPILEHTALVHSTPWDWDVRPCARCGKLVGTPVMKTKRAWLGEDYCVGCERILLSQAS